MALAAAESIWYPLSLEHTGPGEAVDRTRKLELMNAALERCAERLGDVTEPVMRRYYALHPGGRAAFERWADGHLAQLEGSMVENTLFCLMTWLERPSEVQIILEQSLPHHHHTLEIPPTLFSQFVEVTADVVMETIPPGHGEERAVWADIRAGLVEAMRREALAL